MRLPVLVCLGTCLLAGGASAQPAGDIAIDTFRPAIDSRGFLTINASQTLGDREFSFGLGALSWGHKLLAFEDGSNRYSVDNMLTATLIGAYGLRLGWLDLEIGASVPLTIMSGDRGPDSLGDPNNPRDDMRFNLDGQGIGNIGLHLKTRFVKSDRPPHVGVGVIASLYLPTANPAERWLGEKALTPQIMGILDKEFGARGRLRVAVNGGVRLRSPTTFTDTGDKGAPPTNKTIAASAELPFGAGVAFAIAPKKFDVVGEVFGAIPLAGAQNYRPLEAIGGVKLYLARNSYLSLGAGRGLLPKEGANPDLRAFIGMVFEPNLDDRDGDGIKDNVDKCPDDPEDKDGFQDEDGCPDPDNDHDGIPDRLDKCPNVPEDKDGFQDEDGCPEGDKNDRDGDGILDNVDKCPDDPEDFDGFEDEDGCPDLDNDKDGILDSDDLCPNEPEDKDGFEDEDGCPDPDNDKDGIPDRLDKCPNEPETYNNVEDEDGCPDRGVVIDKESVLEILKPINFEYDSDVIRKDSYYILDAVVASLKGNPEIKLVEIAGHTDERGDDAYNLDLSVRRAASVLRYLVAHGIDENRLGSQGYGETQPIDRGHHEAAWAKNRRVEFLILKRTSK
ncbi:MAG: OmpA family protein [Deltaproteobacteria bacterium]|nr:OmpA family protein [Deltaproteobacteria bacterium]